MKRFEIKYFDADLTTSRQMFDGVNLIRVFYGDLMLLEFVLRYDSWYPENSDAFSPNVLYALQHRWRHRYINGLEFDPYAAMSLVISGYSGE